MKANTSPLFWCPPHWSASRPGPFDADGDGIQDAGTAGMNQALFGTENDGSTPTRRFVDDTGLPFVLLLP